MLDLRWIRDNPDALDAALASRRLAPMAKQIIELDADHRAVQTELQQIQNRRNEASKEIGSAKKNGADATALIAEVATLKARMQLLEDKARTGNDDVESLLKAIPNVPAECVPVGEDETANLELRKVGEKPRFNFQPKDHATIGELLGMMDFAGAGEAIGLALRRADPRVGADGTRARGIHARSAPTNEFGYTEVSPPLLVRGHGGIRDRPAPQISATICFVRPRVTGSSQPPEVPLTNLVADEILTEDDLPLRFTALTPCFRSEAGAAGKDTRGMLRQHQFTKVELVSIAHPDKSEIEHERMTTAAEEVLKRLGLHYRVVVLATGDLGFAAHKTYDIEVWLPGQDTYREISSCSNCGDFQARRMRARYRAAEQKGTRFVHTLNGSGLAVGRALIAVLENYQLADGSVVVPGRAQAVHGWAGRRPAGTTETTWTSPRHAC